MYKSINKFAIGNPQMSRLLAEQTENPYYDKQSFNLEKELEFLINITRNKNRRLKRNIGNKYGK